jgi:N6-adenosine-specific RNA methylase IME4
MPFLFDLPIRDYISDVGVLFLECPNTRLSDAFELCRKWGLTYKASVTVYNAKQPLKTRAFQSQVTPEFIDTTSYHILIAQADPAICGATITNIMAVYNKQHPDTAMADIINQMCTCDRDMKLDLTSDTPRTGWKIWKIDYANNTDKQ